MASATEALFAQPLLLLGGAVIAAPIFRKLGLGTVLGYLAAGVVIGPVLHLIGGSGKSWPSPNSVSCCCSSSSDWN